MPVSPRVDFNFINNNIEVTKPSNGISLVLARTTSGPINDPSTIINSVTKFRKIYGSEIVPDGSLSNIEKALKGGSKLRIIRVVGDGVSGPFLSRYSTSTSPDGVFSLVFAGGVFQTAAVGVPQVISFMVKVKEPISGDYPDGIKVKFDAKANGDLYLVTHSGETIIDNKLLWNVSYINPENGVLVFDYEAFSNFLDSSNFELYWKTDDDSILAGDTWGVPTEWAKCGTSTVSFFETKINNLSMAGTYDGLEVTTERYDEMSPASPQNVIVTVATGAITVNPSLTYDAYYITGYQGENPTLAQWEAAADSIKDILDVYVVFASHINQHLDSSDELALHGYIANMANECEEFQYFVELPVTSDDTYTTIVEKANTYQGAIGKSKYVCYFSGGIKYYDSIGILTDSNVLGTVVGLADNCASKYGPYRSFAGLNRGVIEDGNGPVVPNYGSPSRYDELNELAQACVNMIVLKNTRTAGLATLLWHSFTSQTKQDSFRYINAVRLALFIKKQIRPILESYIEEPNIWSSWKRIYLESKSIMDDLITDNAISEYTWEGDQDATSYDDLVVNNEADVRNGKYVLNIRVKDVATMQQITVNLIYEQASNTVSTAITSV